MNSISREEVEGVIFDLSNSFETCSYDKVFLNGWDFVLVDPDYFFDEDTQLEGLTKLSQIDGSDDSDKLNFFLTTFDGISDFDTCWTENYSAESVMQSEKVQWQFAFAGMYFISSKKNWCGIYLDVPCQEVVLLGSNPDLIGKIKMTFNCERIFTTQYIETLLRERFRKFPPKCT